MLSCKDITEKANAYLDKELPLSKRVSVRIHLFMCINCRRYMSQLQTTIQTLGLMKKDESISDEYSNKLVMFYKKDIQQRDNKGNL